MKRKKVEILLYSIILGIIKLNAIEYFNTLNGAK